MADLTKNSPKRKYSEECSESNHPPENLMWDSQAGGSEAKKPNVVVTRRSFSFKEKADILKESETESVAFVCEKYDLNDRTLRKWKAQRSEIEKNCNNVIFQNSRKKRTVGNPDLDDILYTWFVRARAEGIPVSGPVLKTMALSLNIELGGSKTFTASDGWLNRWKHRKGIRTLTVSDTKLSADFEAAKRYKKEFVKMFEDNPLDNRVFNFYTTRL